MIRFEKIRWKNLFSYGNTWTEVELDRSPSTLIFGKNGAGKSVLFEALHICLFGMSIRPIRKQKWVNNKNGKGLEIQTFFSEGDDSYVVTRKVKPDGFTIEKNGVPLHAESSVREMQLVLNRDILKSDKIGFQITQLISKSGIQMFMSLKADERRKFIDSMLGTSVFTEMAKLHKLSVQQLSEAVATTVNSLTRQEALITGKKQEIVSTKQVLADAEKRRQQDIRNQLSDTKDKIQSLTEAMTALAEQPAIDGSVLEQIDALKEKLASFDADNPIDPSFTEAVSSVQAKLETLVVEPSNDAGSIPAAKKTVEGIVELLSESKARVRSLTDEMDTLKGGFCQHCRQDVSEDHIESERGKVQAKIDKVTGEIMPALQAKLDAARAELDELQEQAKKASGAAQAVELLKRDLQIAKQAEAEHLEGLKRDRTRLEDQLGAREKEAKTAEKVKADKLKSFEDQLTECRSRIATLLQAVEEVPDTSAKMDKLAAELQTLETDFDALQKLRNEQSEKQQYQDILTSMLKDDGFKTVVVKKFLPIVNRIVNEKLAELGFFAKFYLDENFDETIAYNGIEDTEFHQFSEGEKLRVNIALLLAWNEIGRMQGRMHSNILMFDETLDGSLDDDGYENLTEIFEALGDRNVFIISHNGVKMENFVRSKMAMVKEEGFSKLAEVVNT